MVDLAVSALLPPLSPVQLIDQNGVAAPSEEYTLPSDGVLVESYKRLVLGRRFDHQATVSARQGRLAVYPSSLGQEACQVGAVMALSQDDWMFPTYRETVALVTRGIPPGEALGLLRGSQHCGYDPHRYRVAPQCTPLATQAVHAVGLALAARMKGEPVVALSFLGDGATSEGDTHEALNFAAVLGAPVVFFVQNNQYAISVPIGEQTRAPSLACKAVGYGMPGFLVDGNDVAAVLAVLERAVGRARAGEGPSLVEALTFRMEAHTNADDAGRYRSDSDVEFWRVRDPIQRLEGYLRTRGVLTQDMVEAVNAEADSLADVTRDELGREPALDPEELFGHVYAHSRRDLDRQLDLLRRELAAESPTVAHAAPVTRAS
jgi:2-oxoisovalerate dehydrogenase E1 component alpha subunit